MHKFDRPPTVQESHLGLFRTGRAANCASDHTWAPHIPIIPLRPYPLYTLRCCPSTTSSLHSRSSTSARVTRRVLHHHPPHDTGHVSIIGQANVARDVARMLLSPLAALEKYDIPSHPQLRRAPRLYLRSAQAAFTDEAK